MTVLDIQILPPLAIARLGSSETPLENYELAVEDPLGHRTINPLDTLRVDAASGEISEYRSTLPFKFRDGPRIRPVAPFLEIFARTDAETLVPLTVDLLAAEGLKASDIRWTVKVGNVKAFRRTGNEEDKIYASATFSDHDPHPMEGRCENFWEGKILPLGSARYIKPNHRFPELRLRYTPAAGLVYGSSPKRIKAMGVNGPIFEDEDDEVVKGRVVYDPTKPKAKWLGHRDPGKPTDTNPGQIYAGFRDGSDQVGWGYLDDECDGFIVAELDVKGRRLRSFARIGVGPPTFAPDTLPIRTVADEIEQAFFGPDVPVAQVSPQTVDEIVRRAFETVRLLNTAVLNGNPVDGRLGTESMMPLQDFERLPPDVRTDNGDQTGRQPVGRRLASGGPDGLEKRNPGLVRGRPAAAGRSRRSHRQGTSQDAGNDARSRCPLSHAHAAADRHDPTLGGTWPIFLRSGKMHQDPSKITPRNLAAQLSYLGRGNPPVTHPSSAISNCFPGLEFDFRAIWRRFLVGILLSENNNYVVGYEDENYCDLVGRRLLKINDRALAVQTQGPVMPGRGPTPLTTGDSPDAVSFMEWSNSIALLREYQGKKVRCEFTRDPAEKEVLPGNTDVPTRIVELEVRHLFEHTEINGTSWKLPVMTEALTKPGELSQGLCSPWQNDYRECACYYWAASRPDYVNVVPAADGASRGDNWLQRENTGNYVVDNTDFQALLSYDDLFKSWESVLRFVIGGVQEPPPK